MTLNKNIVCCIADDDKFSRRTLRNILHDMGCETIEASNGEEAFMMFEYDNPDVIFLDWEMPEMDGLEFLKIANKADNREGVKIIFLTSETNNEKIIEALEENPDEYITKPFNKDLIESALHNVGL